MHYERSDELGASGFFLFNDTATTEIYTLSLHDALPIFFFHPALQIRVERDSSGSFVEDAGHASYIEDVQLRIGTLSQVCGSGRGQVGILRAVGRQKRSEEHTSELQSRQYLVCRLLLEKKQTTQTTTAFL